MVFIKVLDQHRDPLKAFLKNKGILIGGRPPTFRLVIHRDINEKDIPTTVAAFAEYFQKQNEKN